MTQPIISVLKTTLAGWAGARWLLLSTLLCLAGCGGCRPGNAEKLSREELAKRLNEKRDAIDLSKLRTLPTDSESRMLVAKPGHWHETQQQFKSNREDLQVVAVGSIARGNEPASIPGTDAFNEYARRTSLPKGQTKTVDLQYFVPYSARQKKEDDFLSDSPSPSNSLRFRTELLAWPLMTPLLPEPASEFASELKPHEFQLVVLSPQALSYEYLSGLDAVYWRTDSWDEQKDRTRSYYVSLVKPQDNKVSFPHSMLSMTSIAVIVWDDLAADDLSIDQQNALIDWLHWGGQLLISGPSSWSRLQNSFLTPYLPAFTGESTELGTSDFAEISQHWAVEDLSEPKSREQLRIEGNVAGLRLNLNQRGTWLPHSGQLVAESQVGRGRVVVTAFPMRDPRIINWRYYSSFFSTGLLRRHPRVIRRSQEDGVEKRQVWAKPLESANEDPRLHSNLRILSRDLPLAGSIAEPSETAQADAPSTAQAEKDLFAQLNTPSLTGFWREEQGWGVGGAAWSDNSGLAMQAVSALRSAAGIELPSRKTIIYLISGYLICLVPLNWLIFRTFRRLEYAWIAAPVMALIGVAVVTKVARLDIGFARRTTEISLLELQGDHPRGHLTQYLALYTSLSTNYAIEFPENGSVALPLGRSNRDESRADAESRMIRTNFGRSEGVRLEPVTVWSNSTEMLHAEQMVPLPGGLLIDTSTGPAVAIKNTTGLNLKSGLVIRQLASGEIQSAWLGDLASGQSATLDYETAAGSDILQNWDAQSATQFRAPETSEAQQDSLWIGGVLSEVLRKTPLAPGQSRLIAYCDERPGNLQVTPAEDQFDGRCVVVAHLTPSELGDTRPDLNIWSRVGGDVNQTAPVDPQDQTSVDTPAPPNPEGL